MANTKWMLILTLGVAGVALPAPQSRQPADDQTAFQAAQSKSRDKVTTDDTALKPGDEGNNNKSKQNKNRKAPKSPPNPPVVDPHEDPSSPVNQPKTPAGAPAPK